MNSLLFPFAACFRFGAEVRARAYGRGWFSSERLGRPVISVGNLSVGGTGKTPLVARIADFLLGHGLNPSILTRGYGRGSDADLMVIAPGAGRRPDSRKTGDEAALLARAVPGAPIVVSADRVRAARLAEDRFQVDAHILDDGFQHLVVQRDLDIVLIDVTQEFSASAVLPAGRLREPPSALGRADVIVLTRTELAEAAALEAQVRSINSRARVFRCTTELAGFVDLRDGSGRPCAEILGKPIMAFAGIGNARAFFSNLRAWGGDVVAEESFRDHHVYSGDDARRIFTRLKRSGAAALVTTEKDSVNFPKLEGVQEDIPLVACVIHLRVSQVDVFEGTILDAVNRGRSNA
jgi:tetraacyldisaccharide 4'-kinase